MASSDLSDLNPKWVQRPITRAKGWMVWRGTLPIYPNIYYLNYPGAFQKLLSLNLSVLTTKIPVACVGVLSNFGPCPPNFPSVPSHGLMAGTRGSLGRNYPLPILRRWHPRALHCLRAYQLPKLGSALPGNSPPTPTWQAGAPGPFPRVTRAHALPTRPMAPRAPHQRVTRAHYAITAPHGPLAYRG